MKKINKTFIGERRVFSSQQKKEISSIWKRYCDNTSIHGMKYLVEKNLNLYGRWSYEYNYKNDLLTNFCGCLLKDILDRTFGDSNIISCIRIAPVVTQIQQLTPSNGCSQHNISSFGCVLSCHHHMQSESDKFFTNTSSNQYDAT